MFKTYSLFALVILILGITYFSQVQSAVIGLDLGSEFMKISSISPGKSFYIVEDTTTKRKTPTAITFYGGERILEYDTVVKRPRAYQTTFMGLPKFLGRKYGDAKVKALGELYLEDYLIEESERGTISFKLKNFKMADDEEGHSYSLKVEELLGMIFRHIKRLASKQAERQLRDIAVAVPPFWAFRERYALLDSLALADFNPLAFISENTAAALYYSLERQDNETHTAIFYNVGSTSLKVSLVEFYLQNSTEKSDKGASYETVKVLAEAWDDSLGGIVFDLNLVKFLANEFDTKPARSGKKGLLTSNPARAKLLKEVSRLKEVLSANKQSQIYIENIFDSTDLKYMIDRNTFEEANKDVIQRLTKPIDEVLTRAGKTLKDVQAFELIGGGVRVPKIQQVLAEHLGGLEVSTHLNGDESMTLGAAFHAANLSASFKTRQIYVNDGYNFDIRVELKDLVLPDQSPNTEEGAALDKKAVLFPYKTRYGSKKILTFEHVGDVNASFYAHVPGVDEEELVISYGVSGFKEAIALDKFKDKDLGKPKVNLHFRLNYLGLVELNKAEVTIDEIVLYEEKPKVLSNSTKNSTKKSDTEPGDDETAEPAADQDAAEPATETADEQDAETTNSTADATGEPTREKIFKKKTVTHHIPLKIDTYIPGVGPMTEEQLEQSRDLLAKFDHNEDQKKKLAEAKNRLEAYLYSTRDLLEELSFTESSKEDEKTDLQAMLEAHNEWMQSDEAYKADHQPFNKKYEDMNKIVSKIQHRVEQRSKRPEALVKAREYLAALLPKIEETITAKPWITESAKDKLVLQITEVEEWLSKTNEEQSALAHHDDPVLTVSGIIGKLDKVRDAFTRLKNTVKPKPPKNGTSGITLDDIQFGNGNTYNQNNFEDMLKKMNMTMDDLKAEAAKRQAEKGNDTETNDDDAQTAQDNDDTTTQEPNADQSADEPTQTSEPEPEDSGRKIKDEDL